MVSTDFKTGLKGVTGMISTLASILVWFEGRRISKHVFDPQNRAYGFVSTILGVETMLFCLFSWHQVGTKLVGTKLAPTPKSGAKMLKTLLKGVRIVLTNL